MDQNSLKHRDSLFLQIKEACGKVIYTMTCHFNMAERLDKKSKRLKIIQIALSAITSGGFVALLISAENVAAWIGAACSLVLLALNSYMKDYDISMEIKAHLETANALWHVREQYISLLTDFDSKEEEAIVKKRDELTAECASIYNSSPQTDAKSYAKAQEALKNKEAQYFSEEELDMMLPENLRSKNKSQQQN